MLLLTIYMKGVWHILGINATTIVICVLFAIFLPHIGMVIRCSLPIIIMIFIFLLIITIAMHCHHCHLHLHHHLNTGSLVVIKKDDHDD